MSEASAPNVLVEVCVGSIADIENAVAAGADRVELCGALELGGLTPSIGLLELALQVAKVPVVVMLRPRAGRFRYDDYEFRTMLRDLERVLNAGAAGIVFGILDEQGRVDAPRCRELIRLAGGATTVFHRAFDFIADQRAALEALSELGITRVLTSGGQPNTAEGAAALRGLINHSAGRIEIMPGGAIRAGNVLEIVRATGCNQVHIGAATSLSDGSITEPARIELVDRRFSHGTAHRGVLGEAVSEVVAALRTSKLRD